MRRVLFHLFSIIAVTWVTAFSFSTSQDAVTLMDFQEWARPDQRQFSTFPFVIAIPTMYCGDTTSHWFISRLTNDSLSRDCKSESKINQVRMEFAFALSSGGADRWRKVWTKYLSQFAKTDDEFMQFNRGVALFMIGWYRESMDIYSSHWSKKWQQGVQTNLFSLYMMNGNYEKADQWIERMLGNKSLWAQDAKVFLLKQFGTDKDLEQYLSGRTNWHDSLFVFQIAYGRYLKQKGQYQKAIPYYTSGLEGHPKHGEAWLELADLYLLTNQIELAMQSLDFAEKIGIRSNLYFDVILRLVRNERDHLIRRRQSLELQADECIKMVNPGACKTAWEAEIKQTVEKPLSGLCSLLKGALSANSDLQEITKELADLYGLLGNQAEWIQLQKIYWFHFLPLSRDVPLLGSPYWQEDFKARLNKASYSIVESERN